jgi:pyrroline-5-carboxylate reductase
MKIAIIGAGNMGGAIARGLAKGSVVKAEDLIVADLDEQKLAALRAECPGVTTTRANAEAAAAADWVIVAVKPWLVKEVLGGIVFREGQVLVSVAAGIPLADLTAMVNVSGMPIFRLIPNIAIVHNASMTTVAEQATSPEQREFLQRALGELGRVMFLPESKMEAATAMHSCGIAYALKYIQAGMQAGIELGLYPAEAREMVAQSLHGAASLVLEGDGHPAVEIDKVCTPGGMTIKGVNALEKEGFTQAVIHAMKACLGRE